MRSRVRRIATGDQVRLDRAVGFGSEERLGVDNEVLLHGQPADRLDPLMVSGLPGFFGGVSRISTLHANRFTR